MALAGAAIGFAAFGLIRLVGAYGDASTGRFRRLTTAGQAFFYLVMAATTALFLLGRHATGSAQQQHATTVSLLHHPLGRAALVGGGGRHRGRLRVADLDRAARRVRRQHGDPGREPRHPPGHQPGSARSASWRVRRSPRPSAPSWSSPRCASQPGAAKDLDQLLAGLNRSALGHALVWVIAAGFLVFAGYSLLESRYRTVHAGD